MISRACFCLALLFLAGCAGESASISLSRTTYENMKGWDDDRQNQALLAFARSCAVEKKTVCSALEPGLFTDATKARRFIETHFEPYAVEDEAQGFLTGYYEVELRGSRQQGGNFQTPLWQRPKDLRPDVPYDDRAAIISGSLAQNRAKPLLWVDDPVDAYFLEVQGSGRVRMQDGTSQRVGYDGQNNRPRIDIGRVLADLGAIERPVTVAKIRAWLEAHPDRAQAVMNLNPSFVFFHEIDGEGPVGSQGVQLTPGRSLAVDTDFIPFGTLIWLAFDKNISGLTPAPRLVVAQDRGGMIKGPLRGDVFWGAGPQAEAQAGSLQARGGFYVLLPHD